MTTQAPRILVIDDDYLIAMDTEYLVERCGCAVVGPCATVDDGKAAVRNHDLAAAVCDINLADGEDIWPVAEQLRKRGVPVIFASGCSRDQMPEGYESCTLLTKPLSLARLRQALAEIGIVDGKKAAASPQ